MNKPNKSPKISYLGLFVKGSRAILADATGPVKTIESKPPTITQAITETVGEAAKNNKIIAIGANRFARFNELRSLLWLDYDIVLLEYEPNEDGEKAAKNLAIEAAKRFDKRHQIKPILNDANSLSEPPLADLAAYRQAKGAEVLPALTELSQAAKAEKLKIAFFNSTIYGGGVAIMRHAILRLAELLDLDLSWHILSADEKVFAITKKKFHNVLQNVSDELPSLTDQDKQAYEGWIQDNAEVFAPVFAKLDVAVIDDPQPSGLIKHIKKLNPACKIIYRNHIQIDSGAIDTKRQPNADTWDYIWNNVKNCELFVSHPIAEFTPKSVPSEKTIYLPASTDPLDGLNKKLSSQQKQYYWQLFNDYLRDFDQKPLDKKRPYLIQIARFDPAKGYDYLLETYAKIREQYRGDNIPQLVMAGNGAVDDPEGMEIFENIRKLVAEEYAKYQDDIRIAMLPRSDQLLNTLLDDAYLAFQLSIKEGYEIKVSEALLKGKPVIAFRTGGIPLQIDHGLSGFLATAKKSGEAADFALKLLNDEELYKKMSAAAPKVVSHNNFILTNVYKWLYLALKLKRSETVDADALKSLDWPQINPLPD